MYVDLTIRANNNLKQFHVLRWSEAFLISPLQTKNQIAFSIVTVK